LLHVLDIMPTVLSLADVAGPAESAMTGRDWSPLLQGRVRAVRRDSEPLNWELFYRAAVRKDGMKAVYLPNRVPLFGKITEPGSVQWQLYDIAKDPGETRNLAARKPALLRNLQQHWRQYAGANGVVTLPEDEPGKTP
jgi:arylsulfatase